MDDNIEIDEGLRWKNMPSSELAWKAAVLQTQVETGRILRDDELRRIDAGSFELCRRFCDSESPGDIDDVETAISWQTLAIQSTDERSILRRSRLNALGVQFAFRFGSSSDLSDLDKATTWLRCAIELSAGDAVAAAYLTRLGLLLWTRFVRSGEVRDLEDAVLSLAQAAHPIAGMGPADITSGLVSFFARFEATRQSGLLTQFVAALRRATTEAGDPGAELQDLPDLRESLLRPVPPNMVEAIDLLCEIFSFIVKICAHLMRRSRWLASIHDVDGALAAAKCVIEVIPEGPIWHDLQTIAVYDFISTLPDYLVLGKSLRNKVFDDACAAIAHLDRAFEFVMAAHVGDVNSGRGIVVKACIVVDCGFECLPDGDMLLKCRNLVPRIHRAFDQLPAEDIHCDRLQAIDIVCNSYIARHGRFHDVDAMDTAIDAIRHLVHLCEAAAVSLVRRFHPVMFLARLLQDRFYLSRVDADVDEAIDHLTRAISVASTDDGDRVAEVYHALAVFRDFPGPLCGRAERRNQIKVEDVELSPERFAFYSARAHEQDHLQEDSEVRAAAYTYLAKHFAARYERTRDPSDRELALAAYRNAIDTSHNDFKRLTAIRNLSRKLRRWNSPSSDLDHDSYVLRPEVILDLLELNEEEVNCGGSSTLKFYALQERVRLCNQWEPSVARFGEPIRFRGFNADKEEMVALQQSMDVAPSMISEGYSISRRYTEISRIGVYVRLAVIKASARINPIALKWFEQGRAFVWGQILNLRTPLDDGRVQYTIVHVPENGDRRILADAEIQRQELARELERVSQSLETAAGAGETVTALRFGRERQGILNRIRSLDGLEGFLQPKDVDELVGACHAGAVVCLIEHRRCVFALSPRVTTRPDEEKVMFLPFILDEHTDANVWRQRLNLSLGLQPVRKSRPAVVGGDSGEKHRVLQELWYFIVQPVLESLNIRTDEFPADGVDLPRITWCTTGALAFLPLHAAGPYDSRSPNAFDLVVSSYTPNLASILPSRSGAQAAKPNILVVAQPDIAGFSPLPGTRKEADAIQSLFPKESCARLDGAEGTAEGVFDKLRTHNYVHLACHGEQDSEDPLKSSFILHDGRPLTLEKLMEIAHSSDFVGEVAFLSACETATGDAKVPDEAVHLAAGMLAVGYRSVVATMWSIGDNHAPQVAKLFYKTLLAQHEKDGKTDVARALHAAVARLRKEVGVDEFAKWAPFVHHGL